MKDVYPIERLLKFQVTARMSIRSCEQQYIEDDATIGSDNYWGELMESHSSRGLSADTE